MTHFYFSVVAEIWLGLSVFSTFLIVLDLILRHPQKMWIMNIVWPVTALYSGPLGLFVYYREGIKSNRGKKTTAEAAVLAASHCGAGCTLGDIASAAVLIAIPFSIFGHAIYADWLVAFVFAFAFGIAFQYFTIQPMKHLPAKQALKAALKVDTLSLIAWQVGMYFWMGIATFLIFKYSLSKSDPVFWFMMQIAMLIGFLTAYPVNFWLVKTGLKEAM